MFEAFVVSVVADAASAGLFKIWAAPLVAFQSALTWSVPGGTLHVPSAFKNSPAAAAPALGAGTRPDTPPVPLSPVNPPVFGKLTAPEEVATMALLNVLPSGEVETVKLSFPSNPNCARVLKLSWKSRAAVFDDAPLEIVARMSPLFENRTEGEFTDNAFPVSVVPIPTRAMLSRFWLASVAGMPDT